MEQIVVKTEMQSNGEILLFYVDESNHSALNIENQILMQDGNSYEVRELEEASISTEWESVQDPTIDQLAKDKWTDEEIKRLLVFFIDNKDTFVSGITKKKHLWAIACKTMLVGKSPNFCEIKLRNLKRKYSMLLLEHHKGVAITWPLFELCHQAFHNDTYVQHMLHEQSEHEQKLVKVPIEKPEDPNGGVIVVKNVNTKSVGDANVELMLKLYLKHKKNFQKDYWRKGLWETIATELRMEDGEYWHKRFLNFKQHYLRMVAKREAEGASSVNWPYMGLFDQIFENDPEFQRKYVISENVQTVSQVANAETASNVWNQTEIMILVKYCFDCFDEFRDSTIPDNFLWNEVGRLLDKKPDMCSEKYKELKEAHLAEYIQGGYDLRNRKPLSILFDNIISKETELELTEERAEKSNCRMDTWATEETDELVKFLYDNIDMFKDPVCYYVCWAAIASKLDKSMLICKMQWEDLRKLYKSILDDKKENPDMQIDWRYIELFDRIFDYGMDTNLFNDFKQLKEKNTKSGPQKIGVKKVTIRTESDPGDMISDDEEFDERGFTKRTKRGVGDSKAFKILEFYQKHKEKFATSQRKKQVLWETLAQQIGITGEQCAHRFRNLKQVYTSYVQREISKPEMPILWPYYALCKKVFGYRAIKSKLKSSKVDLEDNEEWAAKEIKQIINYFAANFAEISSTVDSDTSKWAGLAPSMGKSEISLNDKFLELRRSYRKLKAMKTNNPECKVSWKYYNLFDEIYNQGGSEMDVEELEYEELGYEEQLDEDNVKAESQDDDDYQCIIVIPEGQDISDISNAKIIVQHDGDYNQIANDNLEIVKEDSQSQDSQMQEEDQGIEMQEDSQEIPMQEGSQEIPMQEDSQEIPMQQVNQEFHIEEQKNIQALVENQELQRNVNIEAKSVPTKWTKRTKKKLLILYFKYVKVRKGKEINPTEMWAEISSKLQDKSPLSCRKMFAKLKSNHAKNADDDNKKKSPYYTLLQKIKSVKPKFAKKSKINSKESKVYKDMLLPSEKVELALQYYLQHVEEFSSPKFEKKYLWTEMATFVEEPVNKLFNKINYLKQFYNAETDEVNGEKTMFGELLKEIINKECSVVADTEPSLLEENENVLWSDEEAEQLLVWYLANLEKFKNPKFVRKYLWIEASSILKKSPLACSKKMSEIRTQYKTMIKESPGELSSWRFYELCQKIYGTGKKSEVAYTAI